MRIAPALAGAALLLAVTAAAPSFANPGVPKMSQQNEIVTVADWDGPRRHSGWGGDEWRGRHWGWRGDEWRGRHWNRCRSWRHECADRWGWGSWRFNRCLARHGC